ncbi:hypothetical protein F8388_017413 [Cannabis sativa]|uniref:DUF4283 domain-containing protein n=1 Tax=Cannabis sativa TaxID=3483 RepID=A0A7J6HB31_CANSA|nr:hypothetical protein F8388_017413 [Cannabis sativa]
MNNEIVALELITFNGKMGDEAETKQKIARLIKRGKGNAGDISSEILVRVEAFGLYYSCSEGTSESRETVFIVWDESTKGVLDSSSEGECDLGLKPCAADVVAVVVVVAVNRRSSKLLIHHYYCVDVPSEFNSFPSLLLNFSLLDYKGKPFAAMVLIEPQPPAPPWMIINSIVVEVTAIFLGATGIFVGIIICSPDMEILLFAEMLLPESLPVCSRLYISGHYSIDFASCLFQQPFLLYLCLNTGFPPFVGFFNFCPALIMDDLSNSFTATLNLTALETQIHSFSETPDHPEDDGREEPSAFLAVKLLTNRHFNPEAFKNRLKQMWPERFSINILEKEPNFFTVEFGCFGDRRRVLIGQPWHFDYKLIVMTPLEAGSVVTAESLTTTPFWIQVSGIPFLKRSRALAHRLGEVLGRFIEVDTTSLKETWGPYLRVRIEIDPQTTLMGLYNAQSSPHINLNHSPTNTTIWPYTQPVVTTTTTTASHIDSPTISSNNLISPHSQPFSPITTAEQLAAPLPRALSTSAETLMATTAAPQHVVPVSQAFSTILADLHSSQPLRFAVGSSANPAPSSSRTNPTDHSNPLMGLHERLSNCASRFKQWKRSLGPPLATQIRDVHAQLKLVNSLPQPTNDHLNQGRQLENKNNWLHAGITLPPDQVLCDATNYLHQYSSCNQQAIISPRVHEDQPLPTACRTAAPTFDFRLYVDAAQDSELLKMGFGMTIHSKTGDVLLNLTSPKSGITTPLLMEAQALHLALSWCHDHAFYPDSVVSDCKI